MIRSMHRTPLYISHTHNPLSVERSCFAHDPCEKWIKVDLSMLYRILYGVVSQKEQSHRSIVNDHVQSILLCTYYTPHNHTEADHRSYLLISYSAARTNQKQITYMVQSLQPDCLPGKLLCVDTPNACNDPVCGCVMDEIIQRPP